MNDLILPSLKGKIGSWVYFVATMKLSDVANRSRVATVGEIAELYPENINEVLQRELDTKRINKIAKYLEEQDERFLSSLIVAICKGNPTWSEIRIEDDYEIEDKVVEDEKLKYARGRLGFLRLNGDEEIFALDGQHRLKGIRDAYKSKPELGTDDVVLTIVVHDSKLKEKTRRLFTVLNRYAEKPKKAEWIIMEEDDAAAILTRRLLLTHTFFKKPNSISKTRGFAIPTNDYKSFSTLDCLYEISKVLINYKKLYPKSTLIKRFDDATLNKLYKQNILPYWDFILKTFVELGLFIEEKSKDKNFIRNTENGGSYILRPEGQLLIAELFKHFESKGRNELSKFSKKIVKIDLNLSNPLWRYLIWVNGKMNSKNKPLKRDLFLYLLGEIKDLKKIKSSLNDLYKSHNSTFTLDIKPIR